MSERGKTVTIIGAGNAAGTQIPPYFVFPGVRMLDGLMSGKSPGADGVMTASGWSNSVVFKEYLQSHFLKYCQGRSDEPVLILYDGHRSQISADLVDWAKSQNIVLFVLPPHTSHILQPMDIGCFGPLQIKYAQECAKFARVNHRVVTRFDVCSLACKAYSYALSPSNLQKSFEKAGIYPFKQSSEMVELLSEKIKPSTLYLSTADCETEDTGSDNKEKPNEEDRFFEERSGVVEKKIVKQKRRSINTIVGGRALEGETESRMKEYLTESSSKRKAPVESERKKGKKTKKSVKSTNTDNAEPSTSGVVSHAKSIQYIHSDTSDSETESQIADSDKCCHCKKFYVDRDDHDLKTLVKWINVTMVHANIGYT